MDLATFLAHAIKLEHEAVETYERLAAMTAEIPEDTAAFLREMAHYARLHLGEVLTQAGCHSVADISSQGYQWGNQLAPESLPAMQASDGALDLERAMSMAHEAERRAAHFYENTAQTTRDTRVTELALQFATEEQGHVLALERFMGIKPY